MRPKEFEAQYGKETYREQILLLKSVGGGIFGKTREI